LPQVNGRDAIAKTFEFTDFSQAWSFMSRSALYAEKVSVSVTSLLRNYYVARRTALMLTHVR